MERVDKQHFFDILNVEQLMQFRNQEIQLFKRVVLPAIMKEARACFYTHFLVLEGTPKIYMSADVVYQNHGMCVSRNIRSIKIYKNEVDMDFYMSLLEYDNTLEPNPVLFNAKGTANDAVSPETDVFNINRVIARQAILQHNLN